MKLFATDRELDVMCVSMKDDDISKDEEMIANWIKEGVREDIARIGITCRIIFTNNPWRDMDELRWALDSNISKGWIV